MDVREVNRAPTTNRPPARETVEQGRAGTSRKIETAKENPMSAYDTYGTPEHEAWLIEREREDDRWYGQPDSPTASEVQAAFPGSCGCVVSTVYGGDCAHTLADEFDPTAIPEDEPDATMHVHAYDPACCPDDHPDRRAYEDDDAWREIERIPNGPTYR